MRPPNGFCTESGWLQGGSHHPTALHKIKQLETPKARPQEAEATEYDHPTFTSHLNDLTVAERERATFECRIEPAGDPTMKIGTPFKLYTSIHQRIA